MAAMAASREEVVVGERGPLVVNAQYAIDCESDIPLPPRSEICRSNSERAVAREGNHSDTHSRCTAFKRWRTCSFSKPASYAADVP